MEEELLGYEKYTIPYVNIRSYTTMGLKYTTSSYMINGVVHYRTRTEPDPQVKYDIHNSDQDFIILKTKNYNIYIFYNETLFSKLADVKYITLHKHLGFVTSVDILGENYMTHNSIIAGIVGFVGLAVAVVSLLPCE